jgi:hypothetical protein
MAVDVMLKNVPLNANNLAKLDANGQAVESAFTVDDTAAPSPTVLYSSQTIDTNFLNKKQLNDSVINSDSLFSSLKIDTDYIKKLDADRLFIPKTNIISFEIYKNDYRVPNSTNIQGIPGWIVLRNESDEAINTTTGRFTCKVASWYLFNVHAMMYRFQQSCAANGWVYLSIVLNGVELNSDLSMRETQSTDYMPFLRITMPIFLQVNDVVFLSLINQSGFERFFSQINYSCFQMYPGIQFS